MDLAGIELGAL